VIVPRARVDRQRSAVRWRYIGAVSQSELILKRTTMDRLRYKIAVLGGTGAQGSGLALRLSAAGHAVTLGSRDGGRAQRAAEQLSGRSRTRLSGSENPAAAAAADIVILTVPYSVQRATVEAVLTELQGKVLVDATAPLMPPRVGTVQLPAGRSAVAAIQQLAGNTVRVVSAFQNVSAQHLNELDHEVDCDVLVCGNDREACEVVIGLCSDIGLRGFYAGPIENSAAAEALTSVLITINRRYKIAGAGIRITGPK
jgi:NADPH-dependent F420 reductase